MGSVSLRLILWFIMGEGFHISECKILLQSLPALDMFPHACRVKNAFLADKTGNELPGGNIEVYIVAMFLLPGPDFPA